MEVNESSLGIYDYKNEIYPQTSVLSTDFYSRNPHEFPFSSPPVKKKSLLTRFRYKSKEIANITAQ